MAEKIDTSRKTNRVDTLYRIVTTVVGIVVLCATVITIYIQVRPQRAKVEIQLLSASRLTPPLDVVGLTSHFIYMDRSVHDLWKVQIRFINVGSATIIGTGLKKNILGEGIVIKFHERLSIIEQREVSATLPIKLTRIDSNIVQIEFSQWRKNENAVYEIYVASDKTEKEIPMPMVTDRYIIDGDIFVKDLTTVLDDEPRPLLEHLPLAIAIPARILGIVLVLIVCIIAIIFVVVAWKEFLKVLSWKARNIQSFNKFLNKIDLSDIKLSQDEILSKPWKLPYHYWNKYSGARFPSEPPFKTWLSIAGTSVITLVIIFAFLALIASSICV